MLTLTGLQSFTHGATPVFGGCHGEEKVKGMGLYCILGPGSAMEYLQRSYWTILKPNSEQNGQVVATRGDFSVFAPNYQRMDTVPILFKILAT